MICRNILLALAVSLTFQVQPASAGKIRRFLHHVETVVRHPIHHHEYEEASRQQSQTQQSSSYGTSSSQSRYSSTGHPSGQVQTQDRAQDRDRSQDQSGSRQSSQTVDRSSQVSTYHPTSYPQDQTDDDSDSDTSDHSSTQSDLTVEEFENTILPDYPRETVCKYQVLKKLGWKPVTHLVNQSTNLFSTACHATSLEEARQAGNLEFAIPKTNDPRAIKKTLANLDNHLGSHESQCGYKLQVGQAIERFTSKLPRNMKYTFTMKDDDFCRLPQPQWMQSPVFSTCFQATDSPSEAMECVYRKRTATECAVGRQLGEMFIPYELFGSKDFDVAFRTNEVVVGCWSQVESSDNFVYGRGQYDNSSEQRFNLGPAHFLGLGGYLANVYGESYLDSPNDRGENFVISHVSRAALKSLESHGGFVGVNSMNKQVWELGQSLTKDERYALISHPISSWDRSRPEIAQMAQILSDPIYSDLEVFVHPLGVHNIKYHVTRLLYFNPRTPYTFNIYRSGINDRMYSRYKNFYYQQCMTPHGSMTKPALWEAARAGYRSEVERLLTTGSDPNQHWMGVTPLWVAAKNGHEAVVEALIKHGATIEARSLDQISPLQIAARKGNTQVVALLLKNGANINSRDNRGMTPLAVAVKFSRQGTVDYLLQNPYVNVRSVNMRGESILDLATKFSSLDGRVQYAIQIHP